MVLIILKIKKQNDFMFYFMLLAFIKFKKLSSLLYLLYCCFEQINQTQNQYIEI